MSANVRKCPKSGSEVDFRCQLLKKYNLLPKIEVYSYLKKQEKPTWYIYCKKKKAIALAILNKNVQIKFVYGIQIAKKNLIKVKNNRWVYKNLADES